jgi:hypothetical protein
MVLAGVLLTAHLVRRRRERALAQVPGEGAAYRDPVSGVDASPEELERLRQELLREDV